MLPHLLDALEFRSNNEAHRPVIDALIGLTPGQYSSGGKQRLRSITKAGDA